MIKTQELTPRIYYNMSRDFQLLGRLYDLILNSVKTDADLIATLPVVDSSDGRLVTLLSTTLGFVPKHKYNSKQLSAICSVLPYVIRNKGSINSVIIAVNALLNAEGITDYLDYSLKDFQLTLFIPEDLSDLTLLKDLMDYITPTGISYMLVKELKETINVETSIGENDEARFIKAGEKGGKSIYYFDNRYLSRFANLRDENKTFREAEVGALPGASMNVTILSPADIKKIANETVE